MGLLTEGHPLSWDEIIALREKYKSYALSQLIRIFEKSHNHQGDCFKWGDELEFALVRFDHANKHVQLLLKAHQLLPRLHELNETISDGNHRVNWYPETCNFMVEGVPYQPFSCDLSDLNRVEAHMALRRKQAQKLLSEESDCEYILNISGFPQFGELKYVYPAPEDTDSESSTPFLDYSNAIMSYHHPRIRSLIVNTTKRRQSEPLVDIPIYRDSSTASPFRDSLFKDKTKIRDNHLYLEGLVAGWGCCSLQVTFQAQSLTECLQLYDQLLPITPVMLALSSACPIWRGYLTDVDCRFNVLSQAGDDRTPEERQQPTFISRCSSAPFYLSDEHDHLNDVKLASNEDVVTTLIDHGMPSTLAHHFGYLFIPDPLVILEEHMYPTDDISTYHFDNLNSTVWHSLRLKPPPLDDDQMGWRVEFRPMHIQITDFENAALAVFMVLLSRVILKYKLDLTIPISKVNENMKRADRRDSVRREKFYFRHGDGTTNSSMMSIDEIINGGNHFPGLIPLIRKYLSEHQEIQSETMRSIEQYLSLISKRAAGTLLTDASWIRQFVLSHPDYKHNSIVSDEIQYDLLWKMAQIENEHEPCPPLLQPQMKTNTSLDSN